MTLRRFKILSLLVLGLTLPGLAFAQEIPLQLGQAFASGNVKSISKLFDERVDLYFDEESGDYSHQQAQVVLNDFLAGLGDIKFELVHQETSGNRSVYYIGEISSSAGGYQVYINVKRTSGKDLIQAIKFEKQ